MRRTDQSADLQSGFNAWVTAARIHEQNLPGMGASPGEVAATVTKLKAAGPRFLWRKRPCTSATGEVLEIHYSRLPLEAIVAYEARHRPGLAAAQPGDLRLARLGTGLLSLAQGGQIRALIIKTAIAEPRLPVVGIRDRCIEHFGIEVVIIAQGLPALVPMPPVRTFQAFVKMLRDRGMTDVQP